MKKSMFREPPARSRARPWRLAASLAVVAALAGIGHAVSGGVVPATLQAVLSSQRDAGAPGPRTVEIVPLRPRKVETLQEMESGGRARTPAVR